MGKRHHSEPGKRAWEPSVRAAIAAAIGVVALLAWSPSANAAFGLTDLTAEPSDQAAGANSDLDIGLQITVPAATSRTSPIHLPPGLVGNPLATPTCSEDAAERGRLPGRKRRRRRQQRRHPESLGLLRST